MGKPKKGQVSSRGSTRRGTSKPSGKAANEPKQRARRPGPGAPKLIPPGWSRQAYFLHPETVYALSVLSKVEGLPISLLVNKVLTEYTQKQRARVPEPALPIKRLK